MYMIQFFGDLPTKAPHMCATPLGYTSIEDALGWLAEHVAFNDEDGNTQNKFWFDCEDDRIVIWDIEDRQPVKAVWHASGWHWTHDAADLPGGPLEQGCLPGDTIPLCTRASD